MGPFSELLAQGASMVVAFNIVTSMISRYSGVPYGDFSIGSLLIYAAVGFLVAGREPSVLRWQLLPLARSSDLQTRPSDGPSLTSLDLGIQRSHSLPSSIDAKQIWGDTAFVASWLLGLVGEPFPVSNVISTAITPGGF